MEEQILRFFLKLFSILILLYFFYIILIKEISLKQNYFYIKKNQKISEIFDTNINDLDLNIFIYKFILKLILINDVKIHYGKFEIDKKNNFFNLIKTISAPSNYKEKFTIVEGWSKRDLEKNLNKHFDKYNEIEYNEAIADTYFINHNLEFSEFKKILNNNLLNLKDKFKDYELSKVFSFNEILIIGSLLEKEGLDYEDKKKIYSVIKNRLEKNMKLQIDATVIYSLTDDIADLDRSLTLTDLKLKHPYNTYYIYGLPPRPISYVGSKTIELIYENYKSNYLFYFFNTYEGKHIFSTDYKNHLLKLNEYRSKK